MKILIISPTQSGIGGISQYVQRLIKFLKKSGHDVDIISSENTFTLPIKGLKNLSFLTSSFFKTKFKKKYDIVLAQNLASALAMKNISGKKILSLHGMTVKQIELLHGSLIGKISEKFEKNALEWADLITVVSNQMYQHYTKLGYDVVYFPNAIDIDSLSQETDRRYKNQILFAGRLSEEKGILDVIKMAQNLPSEIHLVIIGSGPEENLVKKTSQKIPNVHFLGLQSKEKTISLMRGSDILLQPSLMEGGMSTSILEAMACKIPVIATPVGDIKEIVCHMENIYSINPHLPDEMLQGILFLMNNEQARIKIVDNAYNLVLKFDWQQVAKRHLEIYKKILQTK